MIHDSQNITSTTVLTVACVILSLSFFFGLSMLNLFLKIPRLLRLVLLVVVITTGIFFVLRLAFWWIFSSTADPATITDTLQAFYLGIKYDLQLALLMVLPLFILGSWQRVNPFASTRWSKIWVVYLTFIMAAILFAYAVDFGHYAYLNRRVDATVLRFLENFDISMQMVWQTYAVAWWSLLLLLVIAGYAWLLHLIIKKIKQQIVPTYRWRGKVLAIALSTALIMLGIDGNYNEPRLLIPVLFLLFLLGFDHIHRFTRGMLSRWSDAISGSTAFAIIISLTFLASLLVYHVASFAYFPLRWSDAYGLKHNFSSAVASNPVIYFANTFKNRNVSFDIATTKKYYPLMQNLLLLPESDPDKLNFQRHIQQPPRISSQPNVVMVFLESFASYKTTTFGNPLNPTPHFDAIANQGVLFTQYYTPLTGTARSVFAAVTGLPDIELNKTSTRNPLVVNQHTIISDYTDYEKFYFIGGSASWGNIRGLLSFNIPNLHLYEEGMYETPSMDVWGVDDLHLFAEADKILAKQDKPFFAIIQTAGNHRPYNIPNDNQGFTLDNQPQAMLDKYGFIANDEYNAFRFMDHSIGAFIEAARKQKYFDNTVFVFYGDHGITGNSGEHTPAYMTHHELNGLHVPLLIYAPKLLKPQRIDKLASELDLLPTVAGLTRGNYRNTTLGRDLLDPRYDQQRVAFTMMDNTIGLLRDHYYYRFNQTTKEKVLYDLKSPDTRQNVAASEAQTLQSMEALCLGIYETTKYMMYNNPNTIIPR